MSNFFIKRIFLLFSFRVGLFRKYYLSIYLKILFVIILHGIFNGDGFNIWHLIFSVLSLSSFIFVDFVSPDNNPVKYDVHKFKKEDPEFYSLTKSHKRDKKIDEILK